MSARTFIGIALLLLIAGAMAFEMMHDHAAAGTCGAIAVIGFFFTAHVWEDEE